MAAKRRTKARETQLAFEALSIEGGLLSPEWLSKVAQLQAGTQSEADYRIHKGLNLRDEIGRYWRIAQAHWAEFKVAREARADARAAADRFVISLLRDAFGFATLGQLHPVVLQERVFPIGFGTPGGRVPVVVAPAGVGLDTLSAEFSDGARRRSAFGLVQEYLNAEEGSLWGIASDGVLFRIVRDNASLTRPAWIEADLQRIFTEDRYADFAALWLLSHETRFGREGQPVTECGLEEWRSAGREQGTRAREHLRLGVEDALVALGQGFLLHAENTALRAELQNGALPANEYFSQLLRLVYRLIFLLTVEERGLLHSDQASNVAKALYSNGYSIRRLRERSVKRSAHDRFHDLWESTKLVCRGVSGGEPRLGLPALAGIFSASQCPALDAAKLENRSLLLAVFKLAWLREDGSLARVNWRDMGPEELGSVYESLLELVPQITKDGRQFAFATGGETKGNARKTSGSYYTPDSLVQVLLDSALEPVITDTLAKNPGNAVEALLGLSILDPASGSGHFLLAAARRLAAHVARLQANGTPSAADYRHALRMVVGRCIFGVELNAMAVELCKVSLWMEAVEPGLPLTFLNSHIQYGNALLGATPELIATGIPDAAWDPIEGDDKKAASALKKRNKQAAEGQRSFDTLWGKPANGEAQAVTRAVVELDAASDANVEALSQKEAQWGGILSSMEYRHQKFVADAWCSAFVWPKDPGELSNAAPTNEMWRQLRDGQGEAPMLTRTIVGELLHTYRFFHWHIQFPQVFAKGGFDVVLGNPPWERVKLQEQEFFASRSEEISTASNAAARKKLIAKLPETNPQLWKEWCRASRRAEGESHIIRQTGRYPLCGKGDVNTYAIFAEHNRAIVSQRGRAGFIVPSGIATDDTTKEFFKSVVDKRSLRSLLDFQSGPGLFGEIGHARFKFCLLTLGSGEEPADFLFFARAVHELSDAERRFSLEPDDFARLNPNTRTCPTFRSKRDARINQSIYRQSGVIWHEDARDGNPWQLQIRTRLWHMAEDASFFHTKSQFDSGTWYRIGNHFIRGETEMVPLFEAKMLHHFDHRYGDYSDKPPSSESTSLPDVPLHRLKDPTYSPLTRYWVDGAEVRERLAELWTRGWLIGWRDICRSTDERTMVSSLLPTTAVGDKFLLLFPAVAPNLAAALYANLCSFVFDYCARQKVGGTSLKVFTMKQLPALPPSAYGLVPAWNSLERVVDWLIPRVLELTYTAWDIQPFARDVGYEGPPFRWDADRRFLLRCELDAAFFHLYEISRDDVEYIMESFPIVRRHDEKSHNGAFHTKNTILKMFDAMASAAQTGLPYQTRLSPPPADSSLTHSPRDQILSAMPRVVPQIREPAEEVALAIFAFLDASGGAISRTDLARAFTLRAHPELLVQLAPPSLNQAKAWAEKVAGRVVPSGLLAGTLSTLADRAGVALAIGEGSRSMVMRTPSTPPADRLDPWFRFEAQLALQVLRAQPSSAFKGVDESLTGDDLQLLDDGRRTA